MSRSAFQEGKTFTEILELPRLLKAFSHEFSVFTEIARKLEKFLEKQDYGCQGRQNMCEVRTENKPCC